MAVRAFRAAIAAVLTFTVLGWLNTRTTPPLTEAGVWGGLLALVMFLSLIVSGLSLLVALASVVLARVGPPKP